MKVLHVITGLGIGGAELQLELLLRHSRADSEVVTLTNKGCVADLIEKNGVPVYDLGMSASTEVAALQRLYRIIRAGRYDLVHTHLYRSQVYGSVAARLAGVPAVVTTEHSLGDTAIEGRPLSLPVRALYLAANRLARATIAVSDAVRDRLAHRGVPAGKITLIPNGVDVERVAYDPAARSAVRARLGIAPDTSVIGVLGRLDPNKRVDLVIRSVAPLLDRDRVLLIAGDGAERTRLERCAADAGVADRVVFAGERRDVPAVLSAFDMLVAASAQETFGLSILEGLASGLPVLYTSCPALDPPTGTGTGTGTGAGTGTTTRTGTGTGTATRTGTARRIGAAATTGMGPARRVSGDLDSLRRAVAAILDTGPSTRAPAPADTLALLNRYNAVTVAARIDALHARVLAASGRKPPRALATDRDTDRGPDRITHRDTEREFDRDTHRDAEREFGRDRDRDAVRPGA